MLNGLRIWWIAQIWRLDDNFATFSNWEKQVFVAFWSAILIHEFILLQVEVDPIRVTKHDFWTLLLTLI